MAADVTSARAASTVWRVEARERPASLMSAALETCLPPIKRLTTNVIFFLRTPVATLFSKSIDLVISAACQRAYEYAKETKQKRWFKTCQIIIQKVDDDISTRLTTNARLLWSAGFEPADIDKQEAHKKFVLALSL